MKPDPPAKAGPAPPAEADGNCGCSGRGSLQLVVVRELTDERTRGVSRSVVVGTTLLTRSTRTRTGRAVKRGGTTGAASHRQAVLRRARPRVNTCPEPGRPNPPDSTRSPVLVGRTEREKPKLQSLLRPSPGTPAGGRVRPAQLPSLPRPLPRGAYTKPTRYSLGPIISPGLGATFLVEGTNNNTTPVQTGASHATRNPSSAVVRVACAVTPRF